jgi:sugar phosphate isomerase/epimerase
MIRRILKMRVSTSTSIHKRILGRADLFYTCVQSIAALAKAGYRVLDMSFASYTRGALPMTRSDWEDWVKRQKEVSESFGIEYYQGHAHFYNPDGLSSDAEAWNEELIRRSIIGAGMLGVKWLVIHPYSVNDGIWYSRQKSLAKNVEAYQKYGELAVKHHVGIAIENMIDINRCVVMPVRPRNC